MKIIVEKTAVNDVLVIKSEYFEDERGFFMEVYKEDVFLEFGLPSKFVQLNHSRSVKNVLRGLHFQWDPPMGKLMRVTLGEAFLVAVDIRKDSSTFGKWFGTIVSEKNKDQVWAPAGFARGFCVLSDHAEVQYLTTGIYNKNAESGLLWNDPEIGIEWPVSNPVLSDKDRVAQTLNDWANRPESAFFSITNK